MKDILNSLHTEPAIAPVVVTDNTAQVGAIIDRQGFDSVMYAINTGVLADADATFAVTMEEGNDSALADTGAVAAGDLIGSYALASFNFANDGVTRKIGYKGTKRYTRLTITPSANTGAAPMSAMAILGHPSVAPTANPPQ